MHLSALATGVGARRQSGRLDHGLVEMLAEMVSAAKHAHLRGMLAERGGLCGLLADG